MIRLENVSKSYPRGGGFVPILRNINLTVGRGQRLGILGRNGAGKSTLIRLVSGAERPTSGVIHRNMSVSWPLAFGGAFLGRLTGYDNFKFVCRLYGIDPASKIDFVEEFSELGAYFREPLRTYSAGMRARLAFAVSMAVEFDCFLIDEIIAVGDSRFQAKCYDELFVKRADRALLIVSHHADFVREFCTSASVLEAGVLRSFASVEDAYELYSAQQAIGAPMVTLAIDHAAPYEGHSDAADVEAAKGELMEERAQSLARIIVGLEHDPNGAAIMPTLTEAFSAELGDLSIALRVVDTVKAISDAGTAIRVMNAIEPLHGGNSLFHVVLGDLLGREGRDHAALLAYRKAVALDPQSFWGQRNLGIIQFNMGSYAEARAAFLNAIQLPCPETLRLELVRYLIDCATYLDQPAPIELMTLAAFPGDSIEEVTAVHYPNLGLLSVRVQGFLAGRRDLAAVRLSAEFESQAHDVPVVGPASNSLRRYAAMANGNSYAAELVMHCPTNPDLVTVALHDGDRVVATQAQVGVRSDAHLLPAGIVQTDDAPAVAAQAYAAHDLQACILYSRLAIVSGAPIDHEAFAESLIFHGRYHEAEDHLARLFEANAGTEVPLDGRLFDLLCSEIGRSRLPGWTRKLDELIARRFAADPADSSAHTNAGHLKLLENRLGDAVINYAAAARSAIEKPVIHFNRGIFSAQFIDPDVNLPEPVAHAVADLAGLIHLVSCDATYFKRYGPAVVKSSRTTPGHEATIMHVHIVDPDAEALALARDLQRDYNFNVTTEFFPIDDAPRRVKIAYYTSARFILVPKLLQMYQRPVLVTETDCLMNWTWHEVMSWCVGADFGSVQSSLTNFVPWTRIPAGIVYIDCGDAGRRLAGELSAFLDSLFRNVSTHRFDLWTIDQLALWLTWQRHQAGLSVVHLPMYSMLRLATGDKTNIL